MEAVKHEIGEKPEVHITSIGGDLRLTGREGKLFEAQAPEGGGLTADKKGKKVTVTCRSGCLAFIPRQAEVVVDVVGGDARIIGLAGKVTIGTVGGDLSLRRVAQVEVERIGGDLELRKVAGDFSLSTGGGDSQVDRVEGSLRIESQGGDLRVRGVEGDMFISVGGDAHVALALNPGSTSRVETGGDLSVLLPENPSAKVEYQVGGDVSLVGLPGADEAGQGTVFELGEGEATIDLTVGGDLWMKSGKPGLDELEIDLGESIATRIEANMANLEARLSSLSSGVSGFDSERIGERVRKAVSRSLRQVERAQKRSLKRQASRASGVGFNLGSFGARGSQDSEAEQLAILRLVEQGKITTDEAEELLGSLES